MRVAALRPHTLAICGLTVALLAGGCAAPQGQQASARGNVGGGGGGSGPQAVASGVGNDQETVNTQWGPLGPADRDLLVKVRLAGLWEIPTGQRASRLAATATTRRNLGEIARQHVRLDAITRATATKLNVPLPNEPTAEQQSWMSEISGKTGVDYDKTAVARLRAAHGAVYPVIAAVRGSSQNTLIRDFAAQCEIFVHTHMKLLEGTGFVDQLALPTPPIVSSAPAPLPPGQRAPIAPPATLEP